MSPKISLQKTPLKFVKPMFFHRLSVTSTYDSAESIATPPLESDLDDEQIRNMLASPLYLQEREASSIRETLPQCSHPKESRVKKHFPTEKAFPQDINQLKEKVKPYSGSDPEEAAEIIYLRSKI